MAHMIDETTGKPAIAYIGETPWHGLGARLERGQPIDVWADQAGLAHEVLRAPVQFQRQPTPVEVAEASPIELMPTLAEMDERDVLYRSDTGSALSVVGKGYKVVQPREVLDFFAKLAEVGGFELETAGALSGGRRIWGLAKIGDGAPVTGQDVVRPYILLATSYDGTLATTAKATAVRVVCDNTLTMSVGSGPMGFNKSEEDTEGRAVSSLVRIPHSASFDADAVRLQLGIYKDVFEKWLIEASMLAERKMDTEQTELFFEQLLTPMQPKAIRGVPPKPIREGKPFARLLSIYGGEMIGGDLTGGSNRWRALNAVTQFVDWERGRTANSRLEGAWFGVGASIKDRAFSLLTAEADFEAA